MSGWTAVLLRREKVLCVGLSGIVPMSLREAPGSQSGYRRTSSCSFSGNSALPTGCPDFQSHLFWQGYGIRTPQSVPLFRSLGHVYSVVSLPRVYWRVGSGSQKPIQSPKEEYAGPCSFHCDVGLGPSHSLKREDLLCFSGWEFRSQKLVPWGCLQLV